ncbi:MAG: hypothetical protein MUP27_09345 [Desulfobacterales bacterium]|nr:hypothetical protein [Desulfobacterales bacterium]
MIYDCFQFHKEIELLEIRLEELNDYVDQFILVESLETHSGRKTGALFQREKGKFEKYFEKITHILLPHLEGSTMRLREEFQRQAIFNELSKCNDDDLIMYSDLDEIIRGSKISEFDPSKKNVGIFIQRRYDYFLNGLNPHLTRTSAITTFKFLRNGLGGNLEKFRLYGNHVFGNPELIQEIQDGGWHFTAIGGIDRVVEKVQSQSADEFSKLQYWAEMWIKKAIDEGLDLFGRGNLGISYIPIDDTFPTAILRDKGKYGHLIKEVS